MICVVASAASGFSPSGMTKNGTTQTMSTSSATQVTGVVAESGSTISGSALVPNGSASAARVTGQVTLTGSYASSYTIEVRKNGTLVPGATASGGNTYTYSGNPVIATPTVTVSTTATDLFTLWVTTPQGNCVVAAGTGTFVRLT